MYIDGEKKHNLFKFINISLVLRSFINVKSKLQTKSQINQQQNKSKLKNTYRIKAIIVTRKL